MENTNQSPNEDVDNQTQEDVQFNEEQHYQRQRAAQRKRARQQFKSPWFMIGIAFILFIIIYPRCTYKENVRKTLELKASQTTSQQTQVPVQNSTDEELGMVPKF